MYPNLALGPCIFNPVIKFVSFVVQMIDREAFNPHYSLESLLARQCVPSTKITCFSLPLCCFDKKKKKHSQKATWCPSLEMRGFLSFCSLQSVSLGKVKSGTPLRSRSQKPQQRLVTDLLFCMAQPHSPRNGTVRSGLGLPTSRESGKRPIGVPIG